jgi:arginyl-tRNA synthetase
MIETKIQHTTSAAFKALYSAAPEPDDIVVQKTRKEFEGDYTINVFPFLKYSKESPEETATKIGTYLTENMPGITEFNVIKGFLNLVVGEAYWLSFLAENLLNKEFGHHPISAGKPIVIEFSSPNTNKPLHLGHIRNNLLGWSLSQILQAAGYPVVKVNLVNDRGIHICKSMLAWQKWFNGKTPESGNVKGDKLVGDCYVMFDRMLKKQSAELIREGLNSEEAEKQSSLMAEAREMLKKWEAGEPTVRDLWSVMNGWVYDGFEKTYKRLGIDFDKIYYESDTFLLGKSIVEEGLKKGKLFRKDDGSVWADLTPDGLDEKLLLRADGTSVYMTQDLGTAQLRYDEYDPRKLLYVVGNEQNYHFDVLRLILKKLDRNWAENIIHVSYGMVELPEGKMKSREGTVVDADDLMDQMFLTAEKMAMELGKAGDMDKKEAGKLFETISQAALKFFILRVDPKKNMLFNPEESIDFNGHTGPFIQYTYARIKSLLNKAENKGYGIVNKGKSTDILPKEKEILKLLHSFPATVAEAAREYNPAVIANYAYELAREYNQFYQEINILREPDAAKAGLRLNLSFFTAGVIASAMKLLGIDVPEKM